MQRTNWPLSSPFPRLTGCSPAGRTGCLPVSMARLRISGWLHHSLRAARQRRRQRPGTLRAQARCCRACYGSDPRGVYRTHGGHGRFTRRRKQHSEPSSGRDYPRSAADGTRLSDEVSDNGRHRPWTLADAMTADEHWQAAVTGDVTTPRSGAASTASCEITPCPGAVTRGPQGGLVHELSD